MNEERNLKEEVKEIDFDEIIAKYDRESAYRKLAGFAGRFIAVVAILFSLFHLYTAFAGVLPAQIQRSIHLTFALVLAYLLYPAKSSMPRNKLHWSDICLAALGAIVGLYISFNYEALILPCRRADNFRYYCCLGSSDISTRSYKKGCRITHSYYCEHFLAICKIRTLYARIFKSSWLFTS